MSRTVWARQRNAIGLYEVCGTGQDGSDTAGQDGWQLGINFNYSNELIPNIRRAMPGEHVLALGIALHGSMDGTSRSTLGGVALNGIADDAVWLTINTLPQFNQLFSGLNQLLEYNGILYFFGCSMASTDPGRMLLIRISQLLPRRKVVGFTMEGHQHWSHQNVGSGLGACERPGMQFGDGEQSHWGDWASPFAVIAQNGTIIRGSVN